MDSRSVRCSQVAGTSRGGPVVHHLETGGIHGRDGAHAWDHGIRLLLSALAFVVELGHKRTETRAKTWKRVPVCLVVSCPGALTASLSIAPRRMPKVRRRIQAWAGRALGSSCRRNSGLTSWRFVRSALPVGSRRAAFSFSRQRRRGTVTPSPPHRRSATRIPP